MSAFAAAVFFGLIGACDPGSGEVAADCYRGIYADPGPLSREACEAEAADKRKIYPALIWRCVEIDR